MYSAIELSKYIITKCIDDGKPISNLQLQKILYFIQKDYLKRGAAIFDDEIEAWKFGPVVPNVYYYFSGSGAMPIVRRFNDITISQSDRDRCDPIINEKRDIAPWKLVYDTHNSGGAWEKTYQNGQGYRSVISNKLIKSEK